MPRRSAVAAALKSDACCTSLLDAPLSESDSERLARTFAALADPVRLRLLSLVASQASEGGVCSCNLEQPLGRSQPTVSHHTRILVEAGLLVGSKQGRWVWWNIVPQRLHELRLLLGA
jgi:ArsR family transcriptional regulator